MARTSVRDRSSRATSQRCARRNFWTSIGRCRAVRWGREGDSCRNQSPCSALSVVGILPEPHKAFAPTARSQCHPGWGFKKKTRFRLRDSRVLLEGFEVQLVSWPKTRQIEPRRGGEGSRCWALQSAGTGNPAGRCSPRANCEELGSGEASAARGEKGRTCFNSFRKGTSGR